MQRTLDARANCANYDTHYEKFSRSSMLSSSAEDDVLDRQMGTNSLAKPRSFTSLHFVQDDTQGPVARGLLPIVLCVRAAWGGREDLAEQVHECLDGGFYRRRERRAELGVGRLNAEKVDFDLHLALKQVDEQTR